MEFLLGWRAAPDYRIHFALDGAPCKLSAWAGVFARALGTWTGVSALPVTIQSIVVKHREEFLEAWTEFFVVGGR